jgi:hypothetical protein
MRYYILTLCILLIACQPKSSSKDNVQSPKLSNKVFFKNLNEGDTLISPFIIEMGVVGMKIKPAGLLEAGTGHHHLIIDKGFMDYGEIIPMDKQNIHYGKGDTVAQIDLEAGEHTLTLQFANGMHMSYGEQFSHTINVYIK